MSISGLDAAVLENAGFTLGEINTIANATMPDGKDQPPIDLDTLAWQDALTSHREVMEAFFRTATIEDVEVTRSDYDSFIDRWYAEIIKEADPWVWLDQFYFKVQIGLITKKRWEDAHKKIQILKDRVR